MSIVETLGVLAHHGGLLVQRPELSVGVVHAVSRPTGLELELLARRPLDRRSAYERQADIRAGAAPQPAPRLLLPAFDEGVDLRVGWLDGTGRAHWAFGSYSSSSGDHFEGGNGPSLQTVLQLPPMFDRMSLVLAWPEIGFTETVVDLPLPDRATVERDTVSIWEAPLNAGPVPEGLDYRLGDFPAREMTVEAGRIVAPAQVLSRGENAAVVLTRVTAAGQDLSLEILSVAREQRAHDVTATSLFPPQRPDHTSGPQGLDGPGASVAVVHDREAIWARPHAGSSFGGSHEFHGTTEFILRRPGAGALDLIVAWRAAGLPGVHVRLPV